jgi:hypothetical protein
MMASLWGSVRRIHSPISASVRPHPSQMREAGSITQILRQGLEGRGGVMVTTDKGMC